LVAWLVSSAAALPSTASTTRRFNGVTLKLLVNQPRVTSFRDVLATKWKDATGGTLEVTAAP
jgi:hypothetical protein